MTLREAIKTFVQPGMHLHFASTPSRSNAAIREIARQFGDTQHRFDISATGMHSTLHLLGLLGLGQRYCASFFGDNYPVPRPNALYQRLESEGAKLEHWSLGSLVAAFRAGSRGEPFAITNSLCGTDLGASLAGSGKYWEVPDPTNDARRLPLVQSLRADVTFLHAVVGDAGGYALFSPPTCEGFYSALGAKRGVIITVERLVSMAEPREFPHFLPVPPHRVLAICEVPGGAHPQPMYVGPDPYRHLAYDDDTIHYDLWRRITQEPSLLDRFRREVLEQTDDWTSYRAFVLSCGSSCSGADWLSASRASATHVPVTRRPSAPAVNTVIGERHVDSTREKKCGEVVNQIQWPLLSRDARGTLIAARAIIRRVVIEKFDTILAGIGQSFAAARVAKILLSQHGNEPELVVETGLSGIEPNLADSFLLAYRNIVASSRLSDVEHVLGIQVCGNGGRCLGVIGAAQVDGTGCINSTRVSGELLVGSGGANDIASAADEVMVVTRAVASRLPERVDFITSPGARVRTIITDSWEVHRAGPDRPWFVMQWIADSDRLPPQLPKWCADDLRIDNFSAPPSRQELEALRVVGVYPVRGMEAAGKQMLQGCVTG